MSNISTDTQIDNNENKLWKINLDNGEERICGIKRGYKSKNLKTDKELKELKEHKYVDKELHDKLVKVGNETKVNEDYYVIIEKDELKEKLRDKNLYNSEHNLKHTSLSNSCEAYATGRRIIGINKLEDGPGVCCNGEEFLINNDNKDIFNNTGLDVTYNEDNGTLESNKTCYNSNKYTRSDTLLTHKELKNLGRIYNISIKGTKQDICSRLYNKALRFQDDVNKNYEGDLEQEKINKNSTCYQLKKKECNNANNDCDYLNETKDNLLERLMLLDLLTNKSNDYDKLLKSDIIEKIKEYSKDYDSQYETFFKIQSSTYSRCLKKPNKKNIDYHRKFLKNLQKKLDILKNKNLLDKFNDYVRTNRLLQKEFADIDNYNIILKYNYGKTNKEKETQIKNINKIIAYINELLPDEPLDTYNKNNKNIDADDLDEETDVLDEETDDLDEETDNLITELEQETDDLVTELDGEDDEDDEEDIEGTKEKGEDIEETKEDEEEDEEEDEDEEDEEDEDETTKDDDNEEESMTSLEDNLTSETEEDEKENETSSLGFLNNLAEKFTSKIEEYDIDLKEPEDYNKDELNDIKFIL